MIFTQRYRIPFTPVTKHSSLPNGSSVDGTMATETGGFRQLVITYRWTVWKFVTSDSDICGIGREGLDAEERQNTREFIVLLTRAARWWNFTTQNSSRPRFPVRTYVIRWHSHAQKHHEATRYDAMRRNRRMFQVHRSDYLRVWFTISSIGRY